MRFAVHGPGYPVASPQDLAVEPGLGAAVPARVLGRPPSDSIDISGEVKRRFRTGLKAGVSTPPS